MLLYLACTSRFKSKGLAPPHPAPPRPVDRQAVKEELADVLLYLVRLADACDVDLGQAA